MTNIKKPIYSIGEMQACKLFETKWWDQVSIQVKAEFQILVVETCMQFGTFKRAVEERMGEDLTDSAFVFGYNYIVNDLFQDRPIPTWEELEYMVPELREFGIKPINVVFA